MKRKIVFIEDRDIIKVYGERINYYNDRYIMKIGKIYYDTKLQEYFLKPTFFFKNTMVGINEDTLSKIANKLKELNNKK